MIWEAFSEQWTLNHKVTFDGVARRITLSENVSTLDVRRDLYSAWKQWVKLYDNAKFQPAIRTIGGDPIGGGQTAGDLYFLQNNWQIIVTKPITVTGTLFNDTGDSPYIIQGGGGVTATVSAVVQNLGFTGTIDNQITVEPNILPKDVWDYLLAEANTPGSVGERFKSLLTVAKYLGLK